ncbi:uncharacterized protein LOC111023227 [Momordica charantia]|uniref:Uncharacterized protein LOC111023227 n=1 Tax=Momordica charantia TaxID=3673 RepID=A0A6J1DUJ0_MOMCH|nr:uncharacterized protein LOC111023227 [Momordica charantia]
MGFFLFPFNLTKILVRRALLREFCGYCPSVPAVVSITISRMSSSNLGPGNRQSYTSNVDRIENTQPGEASQTTQSSGTTKRKGRHNTEGLNVDKHVQDHGLIEINIEEEDDKPVCSHSLKLVSQIGVWVRSIVSLNCEHWSDVNQDDKNSIINRLSNQFILNLNDPIVYRYLEHEMSSRHIDFRYRLHKHYMQYSPKEARHHKHKDVARGED